MTVGEEGWPLPARAANAAAADMKLWLGRLPVAGTCTPAAPRLPTAWPLARAAAAAAR